MPPLPTLAVLQAQATFTGTRLGQRHHLDLQRRVRGHRGPERQRHLRSSRAKQSSLPAAAGGLEASCIVRCRWTEEESPAPLKSLYSPTQESGVDLAAFAESIVSTYFSEVMFFQKADAALMDGLYAGLSDIDTVECIAYATSMSMNSNEFTLVQVADNADVEAVKAILQARIDYMVGDR